MANVPLVRQQANAIRRDSGATVAEISGTRSHKSKLCGSDWAQVAEVAQIVVVTAQILLDALRQGYWTMSRVSHIFAGSSFIFDEGLKEDILFF